MPDNIAPQPLEEITADAAVEKVHHADNVAASLVAELGFTDVPPANNSSTSKRLLLQGGDLPHALVVSVDPAVPNSAAEVWISVSVYSPSNPVLEMKPTKVEASQALTTIRSHLEAAKLIDTGVRSSVAAVVEGGAPAV